MKTARWMTLAPALLLCPGSLCANAAGMQRAGDNSCYVLPDGTAEIVRYSGKGTHLTIPDTLGGYPVSAIGDEAFLERCSLKYVEIPQGVTRTGRSAFEECTWLSAVFSVPRDSYAVTYCRNEGFDFVCAGDPALDDEGRPVITLPSQPD